MEMGRRDVRRGGTNRFPKKQSGSGFSGKSKNGMLKKLGLAADETKLNRKKREMKMSYEFSSPPSDLEIEVSRKKSKLPKKNLKESNGVDHASVPRKLRSAMKKKRNIESISKLSSGSKRLNRSKTGIESFKDLIKKEENQEMEAKAIVHESMMISKDEKEVAETLYGLADMFTETSCSVDKKTCEPSSDDKETIKVDSISVVETDFTKAEPAVLELSSAKTNQIDEKPLQQDHNQRSLTGMVDFLDRLKQSSSVDVTDATARAIETKVATSVTDYKGNGLALWPGLSPFLHSGSPQELSKPSSTKLPPWMGQAVSPSKKEQPLRIQPRKLKKCASHIYISRLIKVLQNSKSSNQSEQRSSETSERKLLDPVTTISDFKSMVSPPSKRYQNPHMFDLHKTHNPKPTQEDMTKLALELYGPQASHKQSYDFLSLSSNGAAQSHAAQSHFSIPNSFPQYNISTAYNSQLSPATSSHQVQQISSPYLASRFQTAYNANQQQQQQLQKRLWAAQYRPQTSGNTVTPSSNQYSKPNLSLNLTSIQPLHVASSPRYSNNMSHQQQHRLMAAMSMSHHHHQNHNNNPLRTVMNRQEHHRFPLIYEDSRTPLQLLCNEKS